MELDKNRIRAILENWARDAKDCPPDPAEVYYYTKCPDFAHVLPSDSCGLKSYNPDAAELVEDVFRVMFVPYRPERQLLIDFYMRDCNTIDFAAHLEISTRTLYRRLDLAFKAFAEYWEEMGGDRYFVA